jgi:hypothetical protein
MSEVICFPNAVSDRSRVTDFDHAEMRKNKPTTPKRKKKVLPNVSSKRFFVVGSSGFRGSGGGKGANFVRIANILSGARQR